MAALMVELVNNGNITGAVACRAKLQATAARRSRLACLEHWRARIMRHTTTRRTHGQ